MSINLATPEGKQIVVEMFLKDLNQPLIQIALHRSFKRYATLRDQLVDAYVEKTRLPAQVFEDAMAQQLAKELIFG